MTSSDKSGIKVVAEHIKSGNCRRIVLMLGAGVSTSAGIPDFRSPGTGLYANLARLKLPYPEAVFDIKFFMNNPVPFYTLAHELYPGKYRPTPTHSFIRLLHAHSLLSMCFTQNIDTLERRAGVPDNKIIEAHGSFATQRCIRCHTPFDDAKIKEMVMSFAEKKVVPRCERKGCKGLVKPDIVFFGESLPPSFSRAPNITRSADLLIVIGTSLTVHPFASLPLFASEDCLRVLINLDNVGDFGERESDVVLLGKCDDVVKELCRELGWEEELMRLWEETKGFVEGSDEVAEGEAKGAESESKSESESKKLEGEVAKLAEKIGEQMGLDDKDEEKGGGSTSDGLKEDKNQASQEKNVAIEESESEKKPQSGPSTASSTDPIPAAPSNDTDGKDVDKHQLQEKL